MNRAATEAEHISRKQRLPTGNTLVAVRGYLFAVISVSLALAAVLFLDRHGFRVAVFPLLVAIALSVWFTSRGAAILALVLCIAGFNYFFTEPLHTFYVTLHDLPYFAMFIVFSVLLAWFTDVRRRAERDLQHSRNQLQKEVLERTQQASLLDLTQDAIFVRDMSDIITYWNRGAQELFGWTATEALGRHAHQLLRTRFPLPIEALQAQLLRDGRWEGELGQTLADGTTITVASRWSLRRDDLGDPAAVLETNNDISDRKRRESEVTTLNEELAKRTTELEAINKELEAFAYTISHDLRAPLRHMVGFTELLQKHAAAVLDERSRRYTATVLESAKRMGILVDDLLAFSRIGRAETHKTMVSLQQLLNEALNDVGPEVQDRNIVWKIGTLPVWVGDRSMLRLAFVNLVSNAVKFTRTRTPAEIQVDCVEEGPTQVVISVRDNGVGFDMKYQNKLFGVFQRLHSQQEFEGTGIGLATVRRIIHRHGGRVWAEAALDRGATFFFSLAMPQESERWIH
jgi:PAS domain S-box-containing protein